MRGRLFAPVTIILLALVAIPEGMALAQDNGWHTVFSDSFDSESVRRGWYVASGEVDKKDRRMELAPLTWVWAGRTVGPDFRFEFDVTLPEDSDARSLGLTIGSPGRLNWVLQFNVGDPIALPQPVTPTSQPRALYSTPSGPAGGQDIYVALHVENGQMTLSMDDQVVLKERAPGFTTAVQSQVGILSGNHGLSVDNARIHQKGETPAFTNLRSVKLPPASLTLDGRQLTWRGESPSQEMSRALVAYNAGELEAALETFRAMGADPDALLGQAYVLGNLHYQEAFHNNEFAELARAMREAADENPGHPWLPVYANVAEIFGQLAMRRKSGLSSVTHTLMSLGRDNNPFYDKARLYEMRFVFWDGRESGNNALIDKARGMAGELRERWPDHPILAQYLGEKVPWGEDLVADTEAHPVWAASLREAYARDMEIMSRFMTLRQTPDGQLGGGWSDDVELLRTWVQVAAISTGATAVRDGIEKLCDGVWNHVLVDGYDASMGDVEHSAEPSADTVPPMLFLRHGDPLWVERNLQSCKTIDDYYLGVDEKGYPRFRSSYFGGFEVRENNGHYSGDTGYCARAMKHFLYGAWQGNPDARERFVDWADGWRQTTMSRIGNKLPGVVPFTLWYPSGDIHVPGFSPPWSSHGGHYIPRTDMIHDTFLAAFWLSGDRKFIKPYQAAMDMATFGPLIRGQHSQGSEKWQVRYQADLPNNLSTEQNKSALYQWLTGDTVYREYAMKAGGPVHHYWLTHDLDRFLKSFEGAARQTRSNLEMKSTEVLATDRAAVPGALTIFGAYTGAITGLRDASTPTFQVTYDTPTTDFAALVPHASTDRIRIWLYNFEEDPIPVGLQLWRLQPGRYILNQGEQVDGEAPIQKRYNWIEPRQVEVIHRGSGPQVSVPPGKVWVVDLRLDDPIEVPENAPDLAISQRELRADEGSLVVPVHNIGNADAGAFRIVLEQRRDSGWETVDETEVDGLACPRDFVPVMSEVRLNNPSLPASVPKRIRIKLLDESYELCETNNAVTVPDLF